MRLKRLVVAMAVCAAFALIPSSTRADSLSLVLNPSTYVGQSGGSVTLLGTLTNGAGAITFNGYQLDSGPTGLSDAAGQPRDYFSFSMTGGQALTNVAIFTIDIAPAVPNGTVFGFAANALTLFYTDSSGNDSQVTVAFRIDIQNQAVPEPATMALLVSGLGCLAALKRRKRSSSSTS